MCRSAYQSGDEPKYLAVAVDSVVVEHLPCRYLASAVPVGNGLHKVFAACRNNYGFTFCE